ncbi:hypothetical protein D9M71_483630 [compost metagenome]
MAELPCSPLFYPVAQQSDHVIDIALQVGAFGDDAVGFADFQVPLDGLVVGDSLEPATQPSGRMWQRSWQCRGIQQPCLPCPGLMGGAIKNSQIGLDDQPLLTAPVDQCAAQGAAVGDGPCQPAQAHGRAVVGNLPDLLDRHVRRQAKA